MREFAIEPITEEAFAPFGQLIRAKAPGQGRVEMMQELQNLRPDARARLSLASVVPKTLPLEAVEMERHVFSSQAFIPVDCTGYLVVVAPHGADDMPDMDGLRAFRVPGNVGINYLADAWHHPLTALERDGTFVVLTFIQGDETDEQFVPLPERASIGS
ncbi:ureidoglycolate lyase [Faunimonas pinastri]|uniref:Ureidoglycolate lyase n=1 Tax=Faunimonas pinastri TaxID=1855383 RepID=A0A1H9EJ68_9HYPH|nr:ureidoglycolate lyase [Faunimonas pinastri]SEQ25607.1 ureidoglycolate lyase [Faunimonas pinastri]